MVYFKKQPWDEIIKVIDKTGQLSNGATITSATVAAKNISTGADTTNTVLGSSTATIESGVRMKVLCRAGTHGEDHKITFRATLSSGEKFEEEMTMLVREI